jgi:hypothetical protein
VDSSPRSVCFRLLVARPDDLSQGREGRAGFVQATAAPGSGFKKSIYREGIFPWITKNNRKPDRFHPPQNHTGGGYDPSQAKKMLEQSLEQQALHIADCDRLIKELSQLPPSL